MTWNKKEVSWLSQTLKHIKNAIYSYRSLFYDTVSSQATVCEKLGLHFGQYHDTGKSLDALSSDNGKGKKAWAFSSYYSKMRSLY